MFLSLLCLLPTKAQELTIKSFVAKTNDLAASVHERKDLNGNACALVKVQLATAGATFSPNVVGNVEYKVNEYWVYLPTASQHLEVKHPNFPTKDIVFADYGVKLESKATYVLTLSLPETGSVPQMVTKQYLVFNLEPKDATLEVNGETWANAGGISRKLVPFGDYTYTIRATNYRTHIGTVTVNDPNSKKVVVNVSLERAFGSIKISSSVSMDGATVYIDGKNVGTAPLFLQDVFAGNHVLEVKKEGYLPWTENIIIQKEQTLCITNKELQKLPAPTISFTVNGVSFEMVKVEAGTFMMGATPEMEDPWDCEKPVHRVTLINNYYMGKTEVTQALWQAVMGSNPSRFKGDNLPVENVSYNDYQNNCMEFINKLNRITGKNFRLPTEAEWEYAARGGKKSRGYQYSGSNNLADVAWYGDNSKGKTHPVGTKQPNELGIYDMSGNVFEWCQDWYGDYNSSVQTNPKGPAIGNFHVFRGGSWCEMTWGCRSSFRFDTPGIYGNSRDPDDMLGLRLCLSE